MAADSRRRAVSRRRRAGIPDAVDGAVTAGTAAAGRGVRHALHEHAGRSGQLRDADRVAGSGCEHEWIVLTWTAGARPPTKGPFSNRKWSSSLRARFHFNWSLSTGAH